MQYILYNPLAGNGFTDRVRKLSEKNRPEEEKVYLDIRSVDYGKLKEQLRTEDEILIAGGDGTVNRFINAVLDLGIRNRIFLLASGSGNDFLRDIGVRPEDTPVEITDYLSGLPIVEVKGKRYRFLNGVGFGIDGYCCEEGDRKKQKAQKAVNYTTIALKGLLYAYQRTGAEVTVDGQRMKYDQVWMVPSMYGRYYGGGMMAAPDQKRGSDTVSVLVIHTRSKLYPLLVFPGIFRGKHVKHKRAVTVLTGREVQVRFDRPASLQIDGETILDVEEYRVWFPER